MTRNSHHQDAASSTAVPANKIQSKGSVNDPGRGYPSGHLGHLTTNEEATFHAFKARLIDEKLYTAGPPPSHDDTVLLRYLRARRWVVTDATNQFRDTEHWRATSQIDLLYDTIDLAAYEQSRRLYPQWTGRRDRRGIPMYLFEIRHLDSKAISAHEKSAISAYSMATASSPQQQQDGSSTAKKLQDVKMTRLFALYENLTRFVQPLCTQLTDREYPRTPVTLSTNIVDVSGVSLRQFWNLKGHMQIASVLATAHYPETLDRIFIVGAPIFFSAVWDWIKRWFDPVTVSKIFILSSSEILPTLASFVDRENIPKQYGGTLEFNWCDEPNLDSHTKSLLTWENGYDSFPPGPLYWMPQEGGKRLVCVARGSVGTKERNEIVCSIPKAFTGEEEEEEEERKGLGNGTAVKPVEDKVEEASAGSPAADAANGGSTALAEKNGVKESEVPQESSLVIEKLVDASKKFVDAPEAPLASPDKAGNADIQGLYKSSLKEAEKKDAEVAAAVVVSEKTTDVATTG